MVPGFYYLLWLCCASLGFICPPLFFSLIKTNAIYECLCQILWKFIQNEPPGTERKYSNKLELQVKSVRKEKKSNDTQITNLLLCRHRKTTALNNKSPPRTSVYKHHRLLQQQTPLKAAQS